MPDEGEVGEQPGSTIAKQMNAMAAILLKLLFNMPFISIVSRFLLFGNIAKNYSLVKMKAHSNALLTELLTFGKIAK